MNVVIHVVGSRGDVQPFVALGKVLKDTYGHRVRLATHPVFKEFVMENGLEFFSIGGDPAQLMAFMVKNPGLMPGFDTLRSGDVGKRRKEIGEMVKGCWRSCIEAGDGTGIEASDNAIEDWNMHASTEDGYMDKPFVADAIIANPPSFAHIHCAEKLGIPLHIMFTMPYSPTQSFPHPLANIQSTNADDHLSNFMSYALVDMMTWQGLGDVINRFRQKSLGLDPISLMWAPGMLARLKIPHTYCWSPALIPKPKDWSSQISISGFFFLNLASNYTPAPDLQAFLDAGPPPVYIGFGSIVLDDPNGMTNLIFEAVAKTGQRALVSKGWGGFGADDLTVPENIFMLGNVPHDWLFKHVSCVVHHGGAGTTAAGITAGRPTVIVPFFGDQPFWGAMVARAGAGPTPIPHKQLTADNLAAAINTCLQPQSQERAHELAFKISKEKGTDVGAQSFHQMLDVDHLRCSLAPSRMAVWRVKRTEVRLSALAACTLANEDLLDFNDLKLYRPREYETEDGPWDPITGGATALVGTISSLMLGVADMPIETLKAMKIHPDATKKNGSGSTDGHVKGDEMPRTSNDKASGGDDTPRTSNERSSSSTDITTPSPNSSRHGSTFNLGESLARMNSPESLLGQDPRVARSPTNMSSSMADALKGTLGGSKSRSGSLSRSSSRNRRSSHHRSDSQGRDGLHRHYDTAMGTGKGVSRIVGAGLKSPMDFTMGLAQGFHNAPKLYGDESVRKKDQITDLKSGLKAATKEFGFGFYDGITGLVTQPMHGAKKEGAAGFVKGMAKGFGGIVLKPGAAIFGIPGYTFKGIYKELQQHLGSSVQNYIIAARTAQGYDDWQHASVEERRDIIARWKIMLKDLKKKRNPDEHIHDLISEQKRKKQAWEASRKADREQKRHSRIRSGSTGAVNHSEDMPTSPEGGISRQQSGVEPMEESLHLHHAETTGQHFLSPTPTTVEQDSQAEQDEMEEAIRRSVAETSRGDPEEDAMVERAIRASMAELQLSHAGDHHEEDEDAEAIRRAMKASVAEAQKHAASGDVSNEELERALAESMQQQQHAPEEEEHLERALAESQHPAMRDTQHLGGTTKEQFEAQQKQKPGEKTAQEKSEEQIVMEYVKKQSLAEEEHRRAVAGKARATEGDEDHDEELRQAIAMSMGKNGEASGP